MYLTGEQCMMSSEVTHGQCLECGLCGRKFENGHIIGEIACGTCKHYEWGMSECQLREGRHNEMFVRRAETCERWEDRT